MRRPISRHLTACAALALAFLSFSGIFSGDARFRESGKTCLAPHLNGRDLVSGLEEKYSFVKGDPGQLIGEGRQAQIFRARVLVGKTGAPGTAVVKVFRLGKDTDGSVLFGRNLDAYRREKLHLQRLKLLGRDPGLLARFGLAELPVPLYWSAYDNLTDVSRAHAAIVMEDLKDYEPLRLILDEAAAGTRLLTYGDCAAIMEQTVRAVDFIHHAAGITHHDLCPENILVRRMPDGSFRVKIIDLGTAGRFDGAKPEITFYVGHEKYTAPEAFEALHPYTRSIDFFSLGCIIAEGAVTVNDGTARSRAATKLRELGWSLSSPIREDRPKLLGPVRRELGLMAQAYFNWLFRELALSA